MSDWKEFSIGEIADPSDRYSFSGGPFGSNLKSEEYTESGVRIVQLQNIGDGNFKDDYKIYTSKEKANELLSCNIYPGEIILSKMGDPVARATLIPDSEERYLMASDGIRLKVDLSRFDPIFILNAINSPQFRSIAEAVSVGSTRKRIGLTTLKELSIYAPPLAEQKKIADALSSIDRTIQNILDKQNKFKHLCTALTLDILNELSHCQQKPLEQCCKRVCVGFVGTCEPFYRPSGIPLIRTGNLRKGMLDIKDVKYVTRDFHEKEKKSQLSPGDLLIARHGDFGSACIIPDDLLEANCLNVVIIKPDRQLLLPEYLKILLNSASMKSSFNAKAEGSTQKVISTTEIAKSSIPMPPVSKQAEIVRVISSIEESISCLELQRKSLMSLKASMSQDLFSGRKRVSV